MSLIKMNKCPHCGSELIETPVGKPAMPGFYCRTCDDLVKPTITESESSEQETRSLNKEDFTFVIKKDNNK